MRRLSAVLAVLLPAAAFADPAPVAVGRHRVNVDVMRAIERAARATGIDRDYLMSQAAQESGFRTDARAPTSSATGLYQFIDSTWLQMLRDHGGRYGLHRIASAIDGEGRAQVADPELRRRLLDLRYDAELSSLMAAEYASINRDSIERAIGRRARPVDLYLGHFLGTAGAVQFLTNLQARPQAAAADIFPLAAGANTPIFYERGSGQALTLQQVYDRLTMRIEGRALEISELPGNVRHERGVTVIAGPSVVPGTPRNGVEMLRFASGTVEVIRPSAGGIGGGFFSRMTATPTVAEAAPAPAGTAAIRPAPTGRLYDVRTRARR